MFSDDEFFLTDTELVGEKPMVEEKEKKVSFFDLFNDITNHGDYIDNFFSVKKEMPKEYNAYMMNKAFANFSDTILIANEINKHYNIPDEIKDEVITVIKRFENLINEEDSFIYFDYVACKMEISAFKYESFKEYLISKGFSLHEYARSTRIVFVNIMLTEDSLKENNPFGLRERSNFLCLKK